MISENKKKSKTFVIMLVLALTVLFAFQANPVCASTPYVLNIEYYTIENNTFVSITAYHVREGFEGEIDPNHYVEKAIFEINGTLKEVALEAQSTETFTVEYNMGEVMENETYNVRARIECSFHGLSIWSDTMVIPEFSTLPLLLVLAIASIAVLLFKSRAKLNYNET